MPDLFLVLILVILGLVFGSFVSALSYRAIVGMSIFKGRSVCPQCKKTISWKDNIPVFSFLFLKGKSRCCKKLISIRYPLIEFFTMLVFFVTGLVFLSCGTSEGPFCVWKNLLGSWSLPYLILVAVFLITVFVTDFEHKLIPDRFVFIPFVFTLLLIIFFNPDYSYANLFLSFVSASFFLLIHLFTKGKGMGLGDVKLALLPPLILGWPYTLVWLFLSFVIGAVVGVILIFVKKAKFGQHIPFGPFLILAYFLVLFWGDKLIFLLGLG
jgi:prepilin signal peptidase PulO-like enzyme (type II secretory pathway)